MNEVMILNPNDICEHNRCNGKTIATQLTYSRKLNKIMKLCKSHTNIVVDETNPEYLECCPNCGCNIPVN